MFLIYRYVREISVMVFSKITSDGIRKEGWLGLESIENSKNTDNTTDIFRLGLLKNK